jgi:LuxR family maltose regulon positive regulatory protein
MPLGASPPAYPLQQRRGGRARRAGAAPPRAAGEGRRPYAGAVVLQAYNGGQRAFSAAWVGQMPASPARLRVPRRRKDTLLRPRLVNALLEHVDRKLQLVIAPAGFGKTTLLVDFALEAALPVCWATLDPADRDPATFLETIVAAVRRQFPRVGARTLAALRGSPEVERRLSSLARTFAAEVAEHVDTLAVLVLDDYHEVNASAPAAQLMDELLRQLPDNLRLIIAGRALPTLTVSRLMVEGQVFGLGEADLRFTVDELLTILRRRGAEISPERAVALAQGAEGWIAGFLLSVPHLWEGLLRGVIAAGAGEGPLYDYLAGEAFDRQPPDVQRFLLASSVPETADLDLCTALLGPGNWRALLDRVDGAGLFLTRQDRGTFRYHQLFRGFLQSRLARTDPTTYAELHGRAARALAARGAWQAALAHFRAAGEEAEAAALVTRMAPELERSGRWRALADAVAALPLPCLAAHPWLLLAGARAAVMTAELGRAEQLAQAAEEAGRRQGDRLLEAWGAECRGNALRLQGRTAEALTALRFALARNPGDAALAASVRRDLGSCLGVQGDFAAAVAEFRAALDYFDRTGAAYDAARTEFGLAVALAKSGRLAEAIARYESNLERWRRLGDPAMEAEMLNWLGWACAGRGDYQRAHELVQQGLALARDHGALRAEGVLLHTLGEVLLAAGDVAGARAAFEQGRAVAGDAGNLWMVAYHYEGLALATAFAGDLVRAEELAHHAIALAQRQQSRYQEAVFATTLAAIRARAGRPGAVAALRTATAALDGMESRRELARTHLWLAQALHAEGEAAAARRHLRTALALARELGTDALLDLHVRWDAELFVQAAAEGLERRRLGAILARVHRPAPVVAPIAAAELPGLAARAFGRGTLTTDAGGEVSWPLDKARELFFLLLHHGPRRWEQLLAALWPDAPPARGRALLHTTVYRLRRAVHPQVVLFRSDVYRVNQEMVTWYDVRQFERLVREAAGAPPDAAVTMLQQAVELYTAPFLEGLEAEWCTEERERLEHLSLLALERLADAYTAAGQLRESIAAAERLLARDPFREDVYARVIRAYLRLGNPAAARRQYERCAAVLRAELGVEPGPEIQALVRRLGV